MNTRLLREKLSALVVTTWLVAGCTSLPVPVEPQASATPGPPQTILVTSHGWHTGIVFPRRLLLEQMPELQGRFPHGDYLEIGWGDKGFYEADEITVGITLRAIFWPTDSVVHVVAVPHSPVQYFRHSETRTLHLQGHQLESLGKFISSSFLRDANNAVVATTPGIYGDSQFYAGVGSYFLFNTCNTWTAKGLQSAGFTTQPGLRLTSASVMSLIDSFHPPTEVTESSAPLRSASH